MYDHESASDRQALAAAIRDKLKECNFQLEPTSPDREMTYVLPVKQTGMVVRVYTSIVGNQVRTVGTDAIRIAGVFERGEISRGIVSEKRVNRVGEIVEIVERMYQRMRSVYASCNSAQTCKKCGAPLFLSRANNLVCAAICWVNK